MAILWCALFGHNPPGGPCRRCGWTPPKPERRVAHYWGRVMLKVARPICWRLACGVAAGLFALSVFTWAAPQMSPQEFERRLGQLEMRQDSIEELTRSTNRLIIVHMESTESHPRIQSKLDSHEQAIQGQSARFSQFDGVITTIQVIHTAILFFVAVMVGLATMFYRKRNEAFATNAEIRDLLKGNQGILTGFLKAVAEGKIHE